jgi:hypothetical protein
MKVRVIVGAVLVLLALICFSGFVENAWAASFKDSDFSEYVDRASLLFWSGAWLLVSSIVVFLWGKVIKYFRKGPLGNTKNRTERSVS